jgi:aerotaxis receptor
MGAPVARPTGTERHVDTEELLFSMTDARGVIQSGNSVFVRISRYSEEELLGSPHSIVRHPDMPAGAFTVMWDRLRAGKPMGAYVKNLAKDGSAYWVFATVTPLHEGYLSVRIAPRAALFEAAAQLYPPLLAYEQKLRAGGRRRVDVATAGAQELERMVRAAGFAGYEAFMLAALPMEVKERRGLVDDLLRRQPAVSGQLAEILAATGRLDRHLGAWVGRLDAYQDLSTVLARASTSMLAAVDQLDRAVRAAQEGAAGVIETAPVLHSIASGMAVRSASAVEALQHLSGEIGAARPLIADLRFRIALARLHNDTVATFVREVGDGATSTTAPADVAALCDALSEGVTAMSISMAEVNEQLATIGEMIDTVGQRLRDVATFLGKLRGMVLRYGASAAMGAYVGPIDEQLDAGHQQLRGLDQLGERCRAETVPFDSIALAEQLADIVAALGPV